MTTTTNVRRSEGSEYLVAGHLIVENLQVARPDDGNVGFDLLVTHCATPGHARIHVTSRWAEDYDRSFPIRGLGYDFLIHVALNRGFRFHRCGSNQVASGIPDYFVLPVDIVKSVASRSFRSLTIRLDDIEDLDRFRNAWQLISAYVGQPRDRQMPPDDANAAFRNETQSAGVEWRPLSGLPAQQHEEVFDLHKLQGQNGCGSKPTAPCRLARVIDRDAEECQVDDDTGSCQQVPQHTAEDPVEKGGKGGKGGKARDSCRRSCASPGRDREQSFGQLLPRHKPDDPQPLTMRSE